MSANENQRAASSVGAKTASSERLPVTNGNANRCYECEAAVTAYDNYCAACVAKQEKEYYGGSEIAAFDAYHAAIDNLRRRESVNRPV